MVFNGASISDKTSFTRATAESSLDNYILQSLYKTNKTIDYVFQWAL